MGILKKRRSALAFILSKRKFSLLILLTLFLMMVPLASADQGAPGTTYNSHWAYTKPTINGVVAPGEYPNATVRDFSLEMRFTSGSLNRTLNGRLYVKNDLTHIYAAVQIFNVDFNKLDATGRWDFIALLFDDNHNHVVQSGDQGEEITTHPTLSPCYTHHDLYYDGSSWVTDFSDGKTEDGAFAWNHTAYPTQGAIGNYTVEMKIPFVGADGDAYDLAITTLPTTVGYKIWFREGDYGTDGVYPDNPSITQNQLEITNGATFGNLVLHPLYTLKITTTAGGTTNPVPGSYLYDFGEVASVTAIPSGGYVFDHWELDTVPVGSTNPYSVTMNQNHTLHAVFKSAPPIVGGIAAPIIIPINEPSLLTPLIWLVSAIIPIVLAVVFVKLKKKKL